MFGQVLIRAISFVFSNPIVNGLMVLATASVIVGMWTVTSGNNYSDSTFIQGIIFEAHGMVLDILVIGVLVLWLNGLGQKHIQVRQYIAEIDDFRGWQEREASYRIAGLVRRLSGLGKRDLDLTRCFLIFANLEGVSLYGADLQYAFLSGCKLRYANLQKANLENADMGDVDLYHANLQGARLDSAKLFNAQMRGADLQKADLFHVDLERAFLRDADLKDANLEGAILIRTDLRDAKNLTVDQLCSAQTLYEVILDRELESKVREVCDELFQPPRD